MKYSWLLVVIAFTLIFGGVTLAAEKNQQVQPETVVGPVMQNRAVTPMIPTDEKKETEKEIEEKLMDTILPAAEQSRLNSQTAPLPKTGK